MAQNRIYSLDYLRGIAALGILYFHLSSWTFGRYDAGDFWGRVGLYAVAVFYILSGLTLYLIYSHTLKPDWRSLLTFAIKRTFRIFPLLWHTVGLTFYLHPELFSVQSLLLSISGLFGFADPAGGIGTGVWSIGNVFVFYAVFPLLVLVRQKSSWLFLALCGAFVLISMYFAFALLDSSKPLAPQWPLYINPLNQMVLFAGSLVLGYAVEKHSLKRTHYIPAIACLLAAFLIFSFLPASGDRIVLVSGWNRLIFVMLMFMICGSVFLLNFRLPAVLHKPLSLTAEISFGLYLFHPIIYFFLRDKAPEITEGLHPSLIVLIIFVLSYIMSYLVYRYLELPLSSMGRNITEKLKLRAATQKQD